MKIKYLAVGLCVLTVLGFAGSAQGAAVAAKKGCDAMESKVSTTDRYLYGFSSYQGNVQGMIIKDLKTLLKQSEDKSNKRTLQRVADYVTINDPASAQQTWARFMDRYDSGKC